MVRMNEPRSFPFWMSLEPSNFAQAVHLRSKCPVSGPSTLPGIADIPKKLRAALSGIETGLR
jgi:hypothetical protein